MDKRGFLLAEETLKIIIALISISFLIFFLTSLYLSNVKEEKIKQANSILKESGESLQIIISNLKIGEEKKMNLANPKGWFLFGFTDEKPDSCAGQNCVCLCGEAGFFGTQTEECSKKGICLPVESLMPFERIEIKSPEITEILIKKENEGISIEEI